MATVSLRQKAYDYIHGEILSGRLRQGSLVSEQSLAREIGISRTPVREAIRQLVIEGVVEQVPRYGTVVRTPERNDLAELYEVREALEGFAAAKAAQRIDAESLEVLRQLCRRMADVARQLRGSGQAALDDATLPQFLAADLAFHVMLIRAAGNRRLMKIAADTHVVTRIFGVRRQVHDLRIVVRAYRYHRRIYDALAQGNAREARHWMARHLRASRRQALKRFDVGPASDRAAVDDLPAMVKDELQRIDQSLASELND